MDTSILPQKEYFVYALRDPQTDQVRYVGKSDNVERRFSGHINEAKRGRTDHKNRWIASLLKNGMRPSVVILEVCGENWREREVWWIDKLKTDGCSLTNSKSGGDGCDPTDETRRKMSEAKKGKPSLRRGAIASDETRKKQSDAAKARMGRMSEAERKKYYERMGRPPTISGRKHTDEARAKISEAAKRERKKGRKLTEEQRRRLIVANTGRQMSEETKRKIGEANSVSHAKISDTEVLQIWDLTRAGGMTLKEVAMVSGVSWSTVFGIKHGKTYKHVKRPE